MSRKDLEETYRQLREQLLRGELDEEEFKTQAEQLRFEDAQGRQWKIGWYTGEWYRYDQGQWVRDIPAEQAATGKPVPAPAAQGSPPDVERSRRPLLSWLAPALIVLLLLAGAALIAGWVTGWWKGPTITTAEPTVVAAQETPLPPSPTSLPTSAPTLSPTSPPTSLPTDTPRVEATATATTRATATPGVTATSTGMATATEAASPTPSPPSGTATAERQAPSATPALSGQIYFPVYDPERQMFDIHTINLESGEREVVIGQASQPALSPDGERLAYRSWDRSQRALRVRELTDGDTWSWINFAEAARPSWSPDSENIVFPSQQESDRQWRVYRTFGLEFDRVRRHGGDIPGRVPVWLADGRIVYWECPQDKCGLYVMNSDGTGPTQLTKDEQDTAPAASSDGSQVAFMSNRDGNWEIYLVSTRGEAEARRLTKNAARDGLPTWSPDGRWIAFASDRGGKWAVYAIRPDGSGLRKLFDLGGSLEGEIVYVSPVDQHGWTWETIVWGP